MLAAARERRAPDHEPSAARSRLADRRWPRLRAGRPVLLGVAAAVLALYPIGAGALLLTADGWAVNRANVQVWSAVTAVTGGRGVITPEVFAVLANVALFVPLLAALAVLVPRWWWVLPASALSIGVELYQLGLGTRQADVLDVLANTAGAVLGVWLGRAIHRRISGDAAPAAGGRTTPAASPRGSADAPAGAPDDRD